MSIQIISILLIIATLAFIVVAIVASLALTFFLIRYIRKRMKPVSMLQVQPQGVSAGIPQAGDAVEASLKAHSHFIKRANCSQCGAPKSLPSKTAYMYCDYCSALMDYDFRLANANTNAALTNTVYGRLIAEVHAALNAAKANEDWDTVRRLYTRVYRDWIKECPMAVSPRAEHDESFREQMVEYLTESALTKDRDPEQVPLEADMLRLSSALGRTPVPGSAWRVSGPFWEYAETFKKQMERVYAKMDENGVLARDPDQAPAGVPIQMEYSTFAQGWLPHLSHEDGEKLLKFYGLSGEYDEFKPLDTDKRQCGNCGSEMHVLPDAREVICETCYHPIDVDSQPLPCQKCGAALSFPVDVDRIACPYCSTENRRV
jgi:DNA-directed RNA polymerase subunit RPC12/RpoP